VVSVILLIFAYQKRYYRHLREKEHLQAQFSQELLHTQLEIQEQTLKNIAQEIHDNIGQVLSLAKLNLNRMDINKQQDLEEKIKDSKNLVSKAIQDLRDLSKTLNTDNIAAIGLIKAIEYELGMIRKTGSHKTSLLIGGQVTRLDAHKELILFRIVQEVLNNILKHAGAKEITIQADYKSESFQLVIKDDGNGFDLAPLNNPDNNDTGLGIRNMHNRARMIGADFSIQSALGSGTEVKMILPF
jgi:signal transduction histidine kinase